MNLEAISDEDLMALKAGNLSQVSDAGLMALKGTPAESSTLANLGAGAVRGASRVGNVLLDAASAPVGLAFPEAVKEFKDWRHGGAKAMDEQHKGSAAYTIGDVVAQVVGTYPVGGALGGLLKVATKAPKAVAFANALKAGGLGKGAQGVNYLGRVAAGGITGGAATALTNPENTGTGTIVGLALPGVAPLAKHVVPTATRAVGAMADLSVGRRHAAKAGGILREVAGDDLAAIRAATANAPADLAADQAVAGVKNDIWSALGSLARSKDKTNYFSKLDDIQRQGMIDPIRRIAGGANQTEARQVAEASKRSLNKITTPMRESVLKSANIAGQKGVKLQSEADALRRAAAGSVDDVRRLERAGELAREAGKSGRYRLDSGAPPIEGLPRMPARYSYGKQLSDLAERVSQGRADKSIAFGQAARFKQMQADSIAKHGLKPLNTSAMVGEIRGKLNTPSIGVDPINRKVLENVAETIELWTGKGGGIIDVEALYEIRKGAVNSEIERLLGASKPKAKALRAAGLLKEIKPIIDGAIKTASGGDDAWVNYLNTFSDGMHQINQQKMGAKALELLQESPENFEALAAGNRPKMVEKIFENEYDLATAMGDKIKPIQRVAEEVSRDRKIKEAAIRGEGGLTDILSENVSRFKLPNWINAKVAITNRALLEIESRVNKKTMANVYEAMKTGQNANKLLETLPTKERLKVIDAILNNGTATLARPAPVIAGQEKTN